MVTMDDERTPLQRFGWDPAWQHAHVGNPYQNCEKCKMPFGAAQHGKITDKGRWPITIDDEIAAADA